MLDLESTLLGFTRDEEASDLESGLYLDMLQIRTEADHGWLIQDKDVEQKHGKVWGSIRNAVKLAQKSDEEATVITRKN